MAIPTRILEEIKNSELNANDFYSIYGKESVDSAVAELKKSDEEILAAYSVEAMHKAVAKKLSKKATILSFPTQKIIGYAAAAVLFAAIVVPAGLKNSALKTNKASVSTERVKGAQGQAKNNETQLKLYRQKGREIQALEDGSFARSGDVIQITYNAGDNEYGVIFSVDGNGNITRHFPENSWKAGQLVHRNDETPLDFSYELDNAPDFECFIMVTSKKEFELDNLEQKIKNKTDIDYLTALSFLPKKTEGISFVLEK